MVTRGGADVIVIGQGQSPNGAYGANDVVTDWSSADSVRFAHGAAAASDYAEITAGSFAQGSLMANQLISSGAVNVVALAVGGDVAIYADSADDRRRQGGLHHPAEGFAGAQRVGLPAGLGRIAPAACPRARRGLTGAVTTRHAYRRPDPTAMRLLLTGAQR
jgi:hypothetical protein